MRDEKTIRARLEQLRDQFLQWGTPELQVFSRRTSFAGGSGRLSGCSARTNRGSLRLDDPSVHTCPHLPRRFPQSTSTYNRSAHSPSQAKDWSISGRSERWRRAPHGLPKSTGLSREVEASFSQNTCSYSLSESRMMRQSHASSWAVFFRA